MLQMRCLLNKYEVTNLPEGFWEREYLSAWVLNHCLRLTSSHVSSSIPHDFIYSLLGLTVEAVRTSHFHNSNLPDYLHVDYAKPFHEVCRRFATYMFKSTLNLSNLLSDQRMRLQFEQEGLKLAVSGVNLDIQSFKLFGCYRRTCR
jgi:hypothetical protein